MTANTPQRVDVERFTQGDGYIAGNGEMIADADGEWVRHSDYASQLAQCFKTAGADCDGNEDWRIAPRAVQAVIDLRRDYDEACDEAEDLRAELAERDAEIERTGEQLAECFRIAGGDSDCCQSSQVARAVEVVTDLRQCYDERGQELIAAERAREEACGLLRDIRPVLSCADTYGACGDLRDRIAAFLSANGGG